MKEMSMSPMGMMKCNFLEISPAFLERNDKLSQKRLELHLFKMY